MSFVDSYEFRDLILFICDALTDKMLLHRSKAMSLVIKAFKSCYAEILSDLQVSDNIIRVSPLIFV